MRTPLEQKKDAERLLNSALPFAQRMLREFREFLPYGEILHPNGSITSVSATNGKEFPHSKDLIDILKQGYQRESKSGNILTCIVVYDVRILPPEASEKKDAIALALYHRDGYSVEVYYPYSLTESGDLSLDKSFAQKLSNEIFPENRG